MSTTRIAPLEAPFDDLVAGTFQQYLPPGVPLLKLFRTQAHNPRVLQRAFAGSLLDPGSIDVRARELVILRTCARCGSEYEWGVHVALFSKAVGLSDADVAASAAAGTGALPEHEALLFEMADQLHDASTLSDALWSRLARHYAPAQILELIALVGYYHMISFMANATGIEPEAFAPRMPHNM